MKIKSYLIASTVVGMAAVAAFTTVSAVSAQNAEGDTIWARIASILGVEQDSLEDALKQARLEQIDERVASGDLDADKASEIRGNIENGEGFRLGMRQHKKGGHMVEELAEYLGIEAGELFGKLKSGDKPSDIITDAGKSVAEFTELALEEIEEHLAETVESERLTQEEADEKLENAPERIEKFLNGEHSPKREGGLRGGFNNRQSENTDSGRT